MNYPRRVAIREREELLAVSAYWLVPLGKKRFEELLEMVRLALQSGYLKYQSGAPLWRKYESLEVLPRTGRPDAIEIARLLWLEGDRDFAGLLEKEGLFRIMTVTGWLAFEKAKLTSLMWLNGLLSRKLIKDADYLKGLADKGRGRYKGLKEATRMSKESRADRKRERKEAIWNAAAHFKDKNPDSTKGEIVAFLTSIGHYGTRSTIDKKLVGFMADYSRNTASTIPKFLR